MKKIVHNINYIRNLFILYFICIVFMSCASNQSLIPGEKRAIIQNIYVEYMNIADAYFSQQNYDKALIYYNKALNNKEIYWIVYYKLAKVHVYKSNWLEAKNMFSTLLTRDSENLLVKESLAYIYAMNNELDKAILLYKELYEILPNDIEKLENYLSLLILNNDYENAQILLDKLKTDFPDNSNIEKFETELKKNTDSETISD